MVSHFIRTVVPLCTPHIRVDTVVEIDMGTQVITHSPNAIHFAAHIVAIYRYLAEVARRLLAKFPSLFCVTDCVGLLSCCRSSLDSSEESLTFLIVVGWDKGA